MNPEASSHLTKLFQQAISAEYFEDFLLYTDQAVDVYQAADLPNDQLANWNSTWINLCLQAYFLISYQASSSNPGDAASRKSEFEIMLDKTRLKGLKLVDWLDSLYQGLSASLKGVKEWQFTQDFTFEIPSSIRIDCQAASHALINYLDGADNNHDFSVATDLSLKLLKDDEDLAKLSFQANASFDGQPDFFTDDQFNVFNHFKALLDRLENADDIDQLTAAIQIRSQIAQHIDDIPVLDRFFDDSDLQQDDENPTPDEPLYQLVEDLGQTTVAQPNETADAVDDDDTYWAEDDDDLQEPTDTSLADEHQDEPASDTSSDDGKDIHKLQDELFADESDDDVDNEENAQTDSKDNADEDFMNYISSYADNEDDDQADTQTDSSDNANEPSSDFMNYVSSYADSEDDNDFDEAPTADDSIDNAPAAADYSTTAADQTNADQDRTENENFGQDLSDDELRQAYYQAAQDALDDYNARVKDLNSQLKDVLKASGPQFLKFSQQKLPAGSFMQLLSRQQKILAQYLDQHPDLEEEVKRYGKHTYYGAMKREVSYWDNLLYLFKKRSRILFRRSSSMQGQIRFALKADKKAAYAVSDHCQDLLEPITSYFSTRFTGACTVTMTRPSTKRSSNLTTASASTSKVKRAKVK